MATPPFLPDETKPADGDIVSQYPAVERTFRDVIETWMLVDHDTAGEHAQVTLPELGSDPSAVADTGFVYTKDDGADTELFYLDDSGNVVQITTDGALTGLGVLDAPATTSMLFYQSAAPTGWTKDTAGTLNNHALRVVTSTAWATGSKGATGFTSVFGASKTAGATTLTAAQSGLPVHTHNYGYNTNLGSGSGGRNLSNVGSVGQVDNAGGAAAASSHNHTLSLDINYINLIRATKD